MPKIELSEIEPKVGSSYPVQYAAQMDGRSQLRVGDAAGLTQFGANIVILAPGAKSSLRHWHEKQDEFLVVTEGELVLVDDHGETALCPGDCAAFPAGDANGHQIVNQSAVTGKFVVVGTHTDTETGWYSDIDMKVEARKGQMQFKRKNGSPIE